MILRELAAWAQAVPATNFWLPVFFAKRAACIFAGVVIARSNKPHLGLCRLIHPDKTNCFMFRNGNILRYLARGGWDSLLEMRFARMLHMTRTTEFVFVTTQKDAEFTLTMANCPNLLKINQRELRISYLFKHEALKVWTRPFLPSITNTR